MKSFLKKAVYRYYAYVALYLSYFCCFCYFKCFQHKKNFYHRRYVIGTVEIANNIHNIGRLLKDSYCICLFNNKYYLANQYDFQFKSNSYLSALLKGPLLLGFLTNCADYFIYIWSTGFCCTERDIDFAFLKKHHKKIICIFVGDDIRSMKKSITHFDQQGLDNWPFYYSSINQYFISDDYEREKKRIAQVTENYADVILTSETSDTSYLTRLPRGDLGYPITQDFVEQYNKFRPQVQSKKLPQQIKIVHAASSPVVKGTPIVRAVIKSLQSKGYQFEYIEAFAVKNDEFLKTLFSADILLCQFHADLPGLLGIEGLLAGVAVLTSAPFVLRQLRLPIDDN